MRQSVEKKCKNTGRKSKITVSFPDRITLSRHCDSRRAQWARPVVVAFGVAFVRKEVPAGLSLSAQMNVSAQSGALLKWCRRRTSPQFRKIHAGAPAAQPVGFNLGPKTNRGGNYVVLSASNQKTEQRRCNAV
jgi:hypothetical protein